MPGQDCEAALRIAEVRLQSAQLLEGELDGAPFAAQLRCTRTWHYEDERGWQLLAAHASIVAP